MGAALSKSMTLLPPTRIEQSILLWVKLLLLLPVVVSSGFGFVVLGFEKQRGSSPSIGGRVKALQVMAANAIATTTHSMEREQRTASPCRRPATALLGTIAAVFIENSPELVSAGGLLLHYCFPGVFRVPEKQALFGSSPQRKKQSMDLFRSDVQNSPLSIFSATAVAAKRMLRMNYYKAKEKKKEWNVV